MEYKKFKEVQQRSNTKRRVINPRFLSIRTRVNEEEYRTIVDAATSQKKSISAFLRDAAIDKANKKTV
jgi:uncharacterized protein (DUF1778 family)